MLDTSDPLTCNRYRIAYAEAARLLESPRFDRVGGESGAILAVVLLRCPGVPPDLAKLAVDDAVDGRRPRW